MYRILLLLVCTVIATTALQAQNSLLNAIKAKNLPKVQKLLESGADVNALDANGATPLMWAAYQGDLEMVKWLVDNGADPFLKKGVIYLNKEKTAYYGNLTGIAAAEGKLEMLRYLIEEIGISVDDKEYNPETGQEDGLTAAQWADSRVHGEVMAYLEKNADISFLSDTKRRFEADIKNAIDFYKATAYHSSAILFENHIEVLESAYGSNDKTRFTQLLYIIAKSWLHAGDYRRARHYFVKQKEIYKTVVGKDHPSYARSLGNIAAMHMRLGQYEEAEQLHIQSRDILKEYLGEKHPDYVTSLNNLAALYESMGQYNEAVPLMLKALEIDKAQFGEEKQSYPDYLNNLAVLYLKMGRYVDAESLNLQATEIYKEQLGEDHLHYANSLNTKLAIYQSMGRYEDAEPLMISVMQIRKNQLGEDHSEYAASLNNLGSLYCLMGRYKEAEPLFTQATETMKVQLGKYHPDYASSLNNLAILYQAMMRYSDAELMYSEVLGIRKMQIGEKHPDYAISISSLAGLYLSMGRYEEAEQFYSQAMEICKEQLGENHPYYAKSLNNLASLYKRIGRYAEAEPLLLQGQQVYLQQLQTVFPTFSEKEKELFLKTFSNSFEYFHSFSLKRQGGNPAITATQYDNTLLLKGLLLQSSAQIREGVLSSGDTTTIRLFEDWQALKRQWLRQSEILKSEREKAGIAPEATLARANTLEKELSRRSEAFAEATDTVGTTWKEVQQGLQHGEAAIELVRFRWHDKNWTDTIHYSALIVTPDTKAHPHLVLLENGNELEERGAQSYQSAFSTRGVRPLAKVKNPIPADSLYGYFWQPIQAALDSLGGAGKVYLSADGVYHTLNLQTLKNPETGRYLLETLDIERVGSTRDLVKMKKQRPNNNKAVLAGYPSYPASPEAVAAALQRYQQGQAAPELTASRSSSNYGSYQTYRAIDATRSSIDPLPGTLTEVEQLASILEREGIPSQALLENVASEDVLKKVKSPRILHIATHAFFEPESEKPAEGLNREMLMSGLGRETVTENPYLRCGLYLAGAETTLKNRGNAYFQRPEGQEDGILTAYEATLLDLRGTELVVLSACETGLGVTKNGEGVYGLQRAFQVAGAETVIFSLWKVADEQTQEMMGLFYQNWLQKNMTKRQAFKTAQHTIKEKYENPYFWGGFVMIGG
jgi:CHAT domain-containing protein/Flp pilus assembly protein TadD